MKRNFIYIVLSLLLFSGCGITFKSIEDKENENRAYATASACNEDLGEAKKSAVAALAKLTSIESPAVLEQSRLNRIDWKKNFCYEAILTYKGWSLYKQELQEQRAAILKRSETGSNRVAYDEKGNMVRELVQQQAAFNAMLERAEKIAPTQIPKLSLDKAALEQAINALPSASIKLTSCNQNSNYRCAVGFVPVVKDESKKLRYHWDFGDKASSTERTPSHTYKMPGRYKATLYVEDDKEGNSSVETIVNVLKWTRPVAVFGLNKNDYKSGESVHFNNGSYSKSSRLKSYEWNFGDGEYSSARNPDHRYKKGGTYSVVLEVCDADGFCTTASTRIKIGFPAVLDAVKGENIHLYMAKHGQPLDEVNKKDAVMKAYKYGNVWILAKRDKIECAVADGGLGTNLMGDPKKCHWHEKHAADYIVELQ